MTKVEKLIDRLESFMSTDDVDTDGKSVWYKGKKLLDELIQAVRDEEWDCSCRRDACERYPGAEHWCCNCPAKGTRYCP